MIEMTAKLVIVALVDELRMTWRKGCNNSGASTVDTSLQPARSLLKRAKAERRGLSCRLFPFFPRSPHRLARLAFSSSDALGTVSLAFPGSEMTGPFPPRRLCELERCISFSCALEAPPPRMAATEDCDQRACLRIAEVIVIHSVVIKAMGSIAIEGMKSTVILSRKGGKEATGESNGGISDVPAA